MKKKLIQIQLYKATMLGSLKYYILVGFVGLLVIAPFRMALADSNEWQFVKPYKGKKVTLDIGENQRSYWQLDKKKSVSIKVIGPAELKVITRAVIPEGDSEVVFGFVIIRDGEVRNLIGRATSIARSVTRTSRSDEQIGESRVVIFNVPEGEHQYSLRLPKKTDVGVYVRLFTLQEAPPEVPYIAYLPRTFPEETSIAVREREYIYYRVQEGQSVEIEVIGPTRIKGISRLEFDHSMRGDKPYRIQIKERNRIISTKPFTGAISGTASYIETTDKLVGKGDTFYINVPAGRHRYEVTTPDNGMAVLLRFYLPQCDLGNEPSASRTNFDELVRGVMR
ncbi:MAG: hypothetical protein P9M15_03735 [Candidatus Electryoneaceae bacterium]|nr:hypothetical protein [Candidatus Electryoneaceae bacterium]